MKAVTVDVIQKGGLPHIAEELYKQQLHSIKFTSEVVSETELELGVSKLGGLPDLPKGTEWPIWEDMPLAFIAQIKLSDIAAYDAEKALPHFGMLYFFYNAEEQPEGYNPADHGAWKVIYYNGDLSLLERTAAPLTLLEDSRFKACGLRFTTEVTVPNYESLYIEELRLAEEEQNLLWNLLLQSEEFQQEDEISHRLLGHPNQIQGEMQLDCQLASYGLYCSDSTGYEDPRAAELKSGAMDWQLLLQVDSEEAAGMMWGDVGRIYYWIRKQDLKACKFDHVWLVLQCC